MPRLLTTRSLTIIFVALGLTLAATPALAQSQPAWGNEMYEQMNPMVEKYNENIRADDLGVAAGQLKGEKVNLVITDTDGSQATTSFRMDDQLNIRDLKQGERDDATLKMSTDRATMEQIISADNPAIAFQNAIASGDIEMDGLGATSAVKWAAINLASGIARWLGLF
ncbi:hypothetical protein ACFQJ5_16710 [Halomicroarcula sp. GCM10025324]|uniref:hypothetical protein n=1 Tax=Haloarcula TaxID=2237 RepID=UPI0023E78804|nr:hypothetical protein [Halomicroarcula sp. ZS-22-S1]